MEHLLPALDLVLNLNVGLAILVGTAFGIVMGALPGLGTVLAITIALPFTFSMAPAPSIALVLAIYCSSVYGGSISAILINTPGTPQSAATVLDGYPMALRGDADKALGWATIASLIGGLFSTAVLVMAAPRLAQFALSFGPIETFALIALALTCIAGVSRGSMINGLLAGILGLFLATVGTDTMTGFVRFDFGVFDLAAGIELVPLLIGLFALTEVFARLTMPQDQTGDLEKRIGFSVAPLKEWLLRWKTLVKSCVIGTLVGILPGTGASTAAFISYSEAKRSGRYRDKLGTGEPEGLVASEASNNAVTGGALVPTLALGIPGDPSTAVMMSALIIQGIQPGVRLFADNPELMYGSFIVLAACNIVMAVMGAAAAPALTRILRMPEPVLLPLVLVLSIVGAYGVRGNPFDLLTALVAGIVGFFLRLCGVPMAPIVIGMVLGPTFEENLRQGLILTDGSFLAFFSGHPIAVVLLGVTFVVVVLALVGEARRRGEASATTAPIAG
ncbi:tripartite tricarboxylate transporter permease [Marinimicrococcus flavescens]|uniref:Tripartite tricarboxylate transporter permease n=1 Tax=Marinimicrococcus flavescens TaxID=3031815 RepID=A0AAP3UX84_9PROT|nr:tripartite tricarboxylate transporter permease [Marinimicrococcus flavescens]